MGMKFRFATTIITVLALFSVENSSAQSTGGGGGGSHASDISIRIEYDNVASDIFYIHATLTDHLILGDQYRGQCAQLNVSDASRRKSAVDGAIAETLRSARITQPDCNFVAGPTVVNDSPYQCNVGSVYTGTYEAKQKVTYNCTPRPRCVACNKGDKNCVPTSIPVSFVTDTPSGWSGRAIPDGFAYLTQVRVTGNMIPLVRTAAHTGVWGINGISLKKNVADFCREFPEAVCRLLGVGFDTTLGNLPDTTPLADASAYGFISIDFSHDMWCLKEDGPPPAY